MVVPARSSRSSSDCPALSTSYSTRLSGSGMSTLAEQRVQGPLPGLAGLAACASSPPAARGWRRAARPGCRTRWPTGRTRRPARAAPSTLTLWTVTVTSACCAAVLAAGQLGGERLGLPRGHADQRLVEAVQHATRCRPRRTPRWPARPRPARRRPTADRSIETKSPSATGRSTVFSDANRSRSAAEVLLHLVGVTTARVHGHRQVGEVRQVELGPHVDLGGEGEFLAVVELVISRSGWPSANTSCSASALP